MSFKRLGHPWKSLELHLTKQKQFSTLKNTKSFKKRRQTISVFFCVGNSSFIYRLCGSHHKETSIVCLRRKMDQNAATVIGNFTLASRRNKGKSWLKQFWCLFSVRYIFTTWNFWSFSRYWKQIKTFSLHWLSEKGTIDNHKQKATKRS